MSGGNLKTQSRSLFIVLAAVLSDRHGAPVFRHEPEQVSELDQVEQHLFMVSAKADKIRTLLLKLQRIVDYARRIFAAIYQFSQQDYTIAFRIVIEASYKSFQLAQAPVHIAYYICIHHRGFHKLLWLLGG